MEVEGLTAAAVAASIAAGNVKLSSDLIQTVTSASGTLATGTTQIPWDNTIPQNTEGDQYLSVAITPTSAANTLEIDVVLYLSSSSGTNLIAALFQDSTVNALAAGVFSQSAATGVAVVAFKHFMAAGTTSATTFKVRAGGNAGTVTVNGAGGTQMFGGVMSSRITVRELKA